MLKSNPFLEKLRPKRMDDLAGNATPKRMAQNWLTKYGIPRCVFVKGDSGCGKTTFVRVVASAAICSNRKPDEADACGQDDCLCSKAHRNYISFGEGMVTRNAGEMTVEDVKYDFRELIYRNESRPIIFYYDEIHRAAKKVQDILLTKVEEHGEDYNYALIVSTWDMASMEAAFVNRFTRVDMQAPSESEMVALLRNVCTEQCLPFDDQTLLKICQDEYCVPRNCLVTLFTEASRL